jgi:PAS domain S-box-containing protein
LDELAVFLRQLGGGPGADPANAVPRFVIPTIFWCALGFAAWRRWRSDRSQRDGLLAIAASLGALRELFMLTVEYGSYRGLFDFGRILPFYPPFEHALELTVQVLAGYAFVASYRGKEAAVRAYLWTGLGAIVLLYLATAPSWAAFARAAAAQAGPRPEFAQHPGDLAFRIVAVGLLAPVVVALLLTRGAGRAPALAAVAFLGFLLDHALMVVNIATGLRHAGFLSPLRHNLHMWAVPAMLGIYWRELVEALRSSERQLSLVLEGSSEGFWDWNLATRQLTVSPRGMGLLGREGVEMLPRARAWRPFVHPDDLPAVDRAGIGLRDGRSTARLQIRMVGAAGAWRWIELSGKVVERSRSGRPLRAAGTLRDVTAERNAEAQRRELEVQVLRGQKMESLGMLAGGVAHDFSNLLAVVRSNLDFALEQLPPGATADAVQDAQTGAKRALELTAQLLAYAGRGETHAELVRVDRLAAETVRLMKSSIPAGCLLDLDAPDDLPAVFADATQLRQVLMNLLLNAGQAMKGRSGVLAVRAGVQEHGGGLVPDAATPDPLPAQRYVWVEVEDRGKGMDEATRARIFDPFFTTRPDGRGLGLPVVLGIVRGHGGAVSVRSAPGQGTTVRVLIPVPTGAEARREPVRPELTPKPRPEAPGA